MTAPRERTLFLNVGHFVDHLFMLLFAKAAFDAGVDFGFGRDLAYAEMIPYGTPAAFLFGAGAPLAAHLADRTSRASMLSVFFLGIGASALFASMARSPMELAVALAGIGLFASIYHPIGIAMLVEGGGNVGSRLGVNGVWGNLGVAAAPLLAGFAISNFNWRMAFAGPGLAALFVGVGFMMRQRRDREARAVPIQANATADVMTEGWQRAFIAVALVTLSGGFVFGAITFIIPRLFEVRLTDLTEDPALTGTIAAVVFAVASLAQIIVGRQLDLRSAKTVLIFVGLGQAPMLAWMAFGSDAALLVSTPFAMAFIFGQVPITDVILARTVPDRLRPRILSAKFLLNLSVGAMTLPLVSWMLKAGGGFESMLQLVSLASLCVVLAAVILPGRATAPPGPSST